MNVLYQLSKHPRSRWLIHAIGLASLLIGTLPIYVLYFQPAVARDAANQQLALKLQSELNHAGALRNEFRILTNTLTESNGELNNLLEIPTRPLETQFLGEVSNIATELGIKIDDFHPGEISNSALLSKLRITIRFESTFSATCQFFKRVSELPCLTHLHRLEIVTDGKRSQYPVVAEFELCFRPDEDISQNSIALRK